ncbi:MAG: hypothetical protein QW491_12445 [Thermoproteota archaeon]
MSEKKTKSPFEDLFGSKISGLSQEELIAKWATSLGIIEMLSTELESLKKDRERLERDLKEERAKAEALAREVGSIRHQLQAVYNSYSWRVTAPLRWVVGMVLQVRKYVSRGVRVLFLAPTNYVMGRAIRFVLNHAWLNNCVRSVVIRIPWLYWRLYKYAQEIRVIGSQFDVAERFDDQFGLSPRAQQVYLRLRAAIQKSQGKVV